MSSRPFHILSVVGARPNFMKVAPIQAALASLPSRFRTTLVHTGQHYDPAMSRVFFDELAIPRPDIDLNVGSGSHAQQTAAIMSAFEPVVAGARPDLVLVVGDVNSTLACSLVAVKLGIPVAHVEAGLRSFDDTMPEEINRRLTDQISALLFTTEPAAEHNLLREGLAADRIHFVGNVMIDTLLHHRERARSTGALERLGLAPDAYGLLTLHRPSNVDDEAVFDGLVRGLAEIARDVPLVFPVHPRTRPALDRSPAARALADNGRLILLDPLGYLDFLALMERARVVLTDSGGIQEETTVLGVPCLTLRENTERPITLELGTNTLVGTDPHRLVTAWRRVRDDPPAPNVPPLWDGRAAERVAAVLDAYSGGAG